mmetsp:Transcript_19813/g.66009  ORF Transcript_19813/g.66009 Transcript_19813/m.66009 type:complete len:91 (+) Transcript_19813:290-562(+)
MGCTSKSAMESSIELQVLRRELKSCQKQRLVSRVQHSFSYPTSRGTRIRTKSSSARLLQGGRQDLCELDTAETDEHADDERHGPHTPGAS